VIKELKDLVQTLSTDVINLKSQVTELIADQAQLSENQIDCTTQPSDSEPGTGDTTNPHKPPTSADKHIKTMFNDYINEEKEKARRRLNVIIHNVPESSSEDGNTRKSLDINFVSDMCQQHLTTKISINKFDMLHTCEPCT